jgi:biotin carboxyl carrier protein
MPCPISFHGIIFHLQIKLPQAICSYNSRLRVPFPTHVSRMPSAAASPGSEMPEIKIVTEVAGRVCALPIETGASVSDGDEVAFVEAMKMEIPVSSPAPGKLKSILVKLDDVVTEGQVLAIVET